MSNTRTALVSGGAKRVGRAIVQRLAGAGFKVAFTYNRSSPDDLTWAAAIDATPIQADLTDLPGAVQKLATTIQTSFGRLDVLVNNASIYEPSSLSQTTLAQIRRFSSIHLEAPLLLAQAFAPLLRASHGHIINMVDLLAERPWPQYLAYSTTKAALLNLTLGLARELAPEVTVNGIAPGVVEWPANYPQAEKEKYLKRVPLARAGTPNDVAATVLFLVSGGSYITGQIIHLDGGRSIT
jgi:pteridine reductase